MAFQTKRWTTANVLPILFVVWTMMVIWVFHMLYRLLPLLQLGEIDKDMGLFRQGVMELVLTQLLASMMLICFFRSITTDPGSVPDTPQWTTESDTSKARSIEVKQTGERRFCKWCSKYKPDRCHHCRVCNSCILRMDHHCPWIANCIGFRNHKFFLLLVMYALLTCLVVDVGMTQSLTHALYVESPTSLPVSPSWNRFFLVFGLTVSCIMSFLLLVFFCLHVSLTLSATTTIEFCEKRSRRAAGNKQVTYSLGLFKNLKQVLGPNVFLWLLPVSPPEGSGLFYEVTEAVPAGASLVAAAG